MKENREVKSRRKEKMMKDLKSINYFYILFQTHFIKFNSSI